LGRNSLFHRHFLTASPPNVQIFPMNNKSYLSVISFYVVFIGISIGAYFLIESYGEGLFGIQTKVSTVVTEVSAPHSPIYHVLLALVIVIAVTRVIGLVFSHFHQPGVIGQVVGGILLGPSLFGWLAPEVSAFVLPATTMPFLEIIAQIGIILYMFLVGLELDLKTLQKNAHTTVAVSHASIAVPFILGAVLSLFLYQNFSGHGVPFTSFSLFLGVSMSITAFPVLARILSEKSLQKTKLGMVALTCAAIDDVTAWCLLAFVVSISKSNASSAIVTLICTILYILFMFLVFKPILFRILKKIEEKDRVPEGGFAFIMVCLLLSAFVTELIGIHAIFGAFLFGAIISSEGLVTKDLTHRLEDFVRVLFLPAYFAFTGMRTEIGLVSSLNDWMICGLLILVATVGKFGGTFVAAKFAGYTKRQSAMLGILMNTRGLVELIVLNIGLDLKVISPRLFAMMVIMALVTTFMTGPILEWLLRKDSSLRA
jgi:Kef-type K+ transport system membrane component KefB